MTEWIKNYSMVFVFMTALGAMSAKKEYRKYIQFFIELVLALVLAQPLLNLFGKSDEFFDRIAYDSFWQEIDSIRADKEKVEFLNEERCREYYEKIIETDIAAMAEEDGYTAANTQVKLNEAYELEEVTVEVAKQKEHAIIIGSIEETPEDGEALALKRKIAEYYQIDESRISIRD